MLNADLSYYRSAIMSAAIEMARRELAGYRRMGLPFTWAQAMRFGLKQAWRQAQGLRANALQKIRLAEEAARMNQRERAIADLEDAITGAMMIDSTCQMAATVSGLQARLVAVRAA